MGSVDHESKEGNIHEEGGKGDVYTPGPNAVDVTLKGDGGVLKEIKKEGSGEFTPPNGCKVIVHYEGRLLDGTVFDSSRNRTPFEFNLGKGSVIKGWDEGVATMKKGEVAYLICREDYAYGASGTPKIPPKATLIFEIEVLDWEPEDLSAKKDKGILRIPITEGVGFDSPKETANVEIHIKGEYEDRVFDERDVSFSLGEGSEFDIPYGVEKALEKFIKGETSRLELKPQYGLGKKTAAKFDIPPEVPLTYTVTLKDFQVIEDIWMMSNPKKIEQAKILKEKGTGYFKRDNYTMALKMYARIVELMEYKGGFDGVEEEEAKALLLAANLNISMCHLKVQNFTSAKNTCDKILETDSNNVKALFRRGQAYLGLQEPDLARADFEAVLKIEPDNKAVSAQLVLCNKKRQELHSKEKTLYANMFEKFAQKDREWRFGWLEGDKPIVEIAPENPGIEEERKRKREAKKKYLEDTKRLLEEKREREAREEAERLAKEQEAGVFDKDESKVVVDKEGTESCVQETDERQSLEDAAAPSGQ